MSYDTPEPAVEVAAPVQPQPVLTGHGSQTVETARATARAGSVATADDVLTARTRVAGEQADDATTPEHLMAAALASCLRQAVVIAGSSLGVDTGDVSVVATVDLVSGEGAGYSATFAAEVAGLEGDRADDVLAQATSLCPFTKALAGADLKVALAA